MTRIYEKNDKVEELIEQATQDAEDNGLNNEQVNILVKPLKKYQEVFRTSFGQDPPVKVQPLKVRLKSGAELVKSSTRRYPPLHREYMESHTAECIKHGLVYVNPRSTAPRIVPKKNPGEFRMTIDVRGVNACTEPMPWPMPTF
jgi:hypothetical protein